MPNISEELYDVGADLLFKALAALASITVDTAKITDMVFKENFVSLINKIQKGNLSHKEKKALEQIHAAVENDGEIPLQATILESDRALMEKWLKKQNVLFVTLKAENQKVEAGQEKCVITFLERDSEAVQNAIALTQQERGYINEIPATAFMFLHKKKDLVVVDNLDAYELEMFREFAKDHGLVYSSILNAPDTNPKGESYKILVSKDNVYKATAIMQQVSWGMTGEYQNGIKEKIKERHSIIYEVHNLVEHGVESGKVKVKNQSGESVTVENARYIVNQNAPHQYIKMTSAGFVYYKFGKEVENLSKGDSEYKNKLENILGEFSGAVIFDAKEWEENNLHKSNARKTKVIEKASVFPTGFDKVKDVNELQKARDSKKKAHKDVYEETAWLFDRYDTQKAFSEVYEVNYDNYSEPLERTVSVHYDNALNKAKEYKYIDVSNDAKSIDNIIHAARERSVSNNTYNFDKEVARGHE